MGEAQFTTKNCLSLVLTRRGEGETSRVGLGAGASQARGRAERGVEPIGGEE
jgi:hypothetical protein